jgi:hypothetical protein
MNEALRSGINDDPVEPADAPTVEPQPDGSPDSDRPERPHRVFTRLAKYSPRTRRWHAPVTNHDPAEGDEARKATGA